MFWRLRSHTPTKTSGQLPPGLWPWFHLISKLLVAGFKVQVNKYVLWFMLFLIFCLLFCLSLTIPLFW